MQNNSVEIVGIHRAESPSPAFAVAFLGDTTAFVSGEENAVLVGPGEQVRSVMLHAGAILSAKSDAGRLLTTGDDGRLNALGADLRPACLAHDDKRRWITGAAESCNGALAWSVGKSVRCLTPGATERSLTVEAAATDLAFSPDGALLAVSHNNGVTVWSTCEEDEPTRLMWKGAHEKVAFSPDSAVVVTSMREPTVHAWRLADQADLPTPSYPARVRSLRWTASGRYLLTSGSHRLTALTLGVYDHPLARMPLFLAPYQHLVCAVASHPHADIAVVGYADGLVMMVGLPFGEELLLKAPDGHPISALGWSSDALRIAIASSSGHVRVVVLDPGSARLNGENSLRE